MKDELLGRVSRPSRYIGKEINAVRKDHRLVDVKVALAFPDTYEIGMSHMGLKILYDILNAREDTAAERVFAPWTDMESILRSQGMPLCSLESGLPLKDFDIVGFTLQYEMSFTNILNMLDLSGIPLFAADRDNSHPLVIGGGPCAFNPEPLSGFFDLFVIGDGEEVIGEIVTLVKRHRSEERKTLLRHLAELGGIYVPSHFEVTYTSDGRTENIRKVGPGPDQIRKCVVSELSRAPYPCAPVLPYMKIVHDRLALEISRGCTRGCRFCQAGMIYRPLRERDVEPLLSLLKDSVKNTGYEEVSLTSLSSGDYTELGELVREVGRFAEERHIGVSLPSLRPGTLSTPVIEEIRKIRKTGFTIAPEAGTQRLRNVINKGIEESDLLDSVEKVFSAGWEILKLYFMIGLPTETREDLQGIIDLSLKALRVAKRANPKFRQIKVSVSPFVPKPHTPFQWCLQNRPDEVREKYGFLKRGLRHRKITLKLHDPGISMLEGLFSRGDRRLGRVLYEAWKSGCRFDGWTEEFDLSRWMEAIQTAGLDLTRDLFREREPNELLPWDHVQSGVTRDFLREEYEKSLREETTPDCRKGICSLCGACNERSGLVFARSSDSLGYIRSKRSAFPAVKRFRVRYSKQGSLRFLSHLELMGAIIRAFGRAGIPLEFSKGFHPHPKIAMGPALPVGVSGAAEYLDVNVLGNVFEESLAKVLNQVLPHGIRVTGVNWISAKAPSLSSLVRYGEYLLRIPQSCFLGEPDQRVRGFMAEEELHVTRAQKGRVKTLNIRPMIQEMEVLSTKGDIVALRLSLQSGDHGGVRLDEIVRVLCNGTGYEEGDIEAIRMGLYIDKDQTAPFQERNMAVAQQL